MGTIPALLGGLALVVSSASCSAARTAPVHPPTRTGERPLGAPVASPIAPSAAHATSPGLASAHASVASTVCTTTELLITLGGGGGAAGSRLTAVNFLNRSQVPCVLQGFPGVSFVSGPTQRQVGRAAERSGSATPVVVQPHERAHATLRIVSYQVFDPGLCQPAATSGFLIYPPDQHDPVLVNAPGMACASTQPRAGQLQVESVQEGPPDA